MEIDEEILLAFLFAHLLVWIIFEHLKGQILFTKKTISHYLWQSPSLKTPEKFSNLIPVIHKKYQLAINWTENKNSWVSSFIIKINQFSVLIWNRQLQFFLENFLWSIKFFKTGCQFEFLMLLGGCLVLIWMITKI